MLLSILVLSAVWLLVIAGVVVLCVAAKQGDAALVMRASVQPLRTAISDFTSPPMRSLRSSASGK